MLLAGLVACNKDAGSSGAAGTTSSAGGGEMIKFVTTQDSSPLNIDAALFDTPAAKEFLATGKNPYKGERRCYCSWQKSNLACTPVPNAMARKRVGQVGPGLIGPTFRYPKDATNKGMFETIWHGTNGGMGGKGKGIKDPTDPANGITPDEALKVIAWIRSHGGVTGMNNIYPT